jgi:hypothetical protein
LPFSPADPAPPPASVMVTLRKVSRVENPVAKTP